MSLRPGLSAGIKGHLPPSPVQVRLSLYEMLGDLENKDLLLSLAMQDLTIATGEIRKAAEMRSKMSRLER